VKALFSNRLLVDFPPRFATGVIGTGLFLGTAGSLKNGGPIGLLLGYFSIGTICFSVMISLGEMIAFLPISGGYIKLAERFVNQSFSFTMGWNCWYNWQVFPFRSAWLGHGQHFSLYA
jgi:amino acid permease